MGLPQVALSRTQSARERTNMRRAMLARLNERMDLVAMKAVALVVKTFDE